MQLKELILRKNSGLRQFFKFAMVGIFNTFLDLGLLNLLIFFTGAGEKGLVFGLFKAMSFSCAATSSYLFNKYWVFRDPSNKKRALQVSQFLIVTIIGGAINTVTATIVVTYVLHGLPLISVLADEKLWPTLGGLVGTGAGMFWNFFGYKYLVFKDRKKD